MRHLQTLHQKYSNQGFVILGLNCADEKKIALEFLRENEATFPTILDTSTAATRVYALVYNRGNAVPLSYVIDRQGKIVDAWYGYDDKEGHKRALTALEKAGLKLDQ